MSNNKDFNSLREHDAPNTGTYIRATDALGNKGQAISFLHTPSGKSVFFKAFITAFNETYSSDWAEENVLGRADGIHLFKSTTRSVSLAFKVPAATRSEAYENLSRVQTLIQFLYPSYEDPENALTINQSPLIRLRVMNLLTKGDAAQTFADIFGASGGLSMDPAEGLLGVIGNVTVNHNLETDVGVIEAGTGSTILPKLMEVNVDFNVIHEATLGWSSYGIATNKFGSGLNDSVYGTIYESRGGYPNSPENIPYGLSDPQIIVDQSARRLSGLVANQYYEQDVGTESRYSSARWEATQKSEEHLAEEAAWLIEKQQAVPDSAAEADAQILEAEVGVMMVDAAQAAATDPYASTDVEDMGPYAASQE